MFRVTHYSYDNLYFWELQTLRRQNRIIARDLRKIFRKAKIRNGYYD